MRTTFIPAEMPSATPQHLQAVATTQWPGAGGWLVPWALQFTVALAYQFRFFASRIMGDLNKKQTDISEEGEGGREARGKKWPESH